MPRTIYRRRCLLVKEGELLCGKIEPLPVPKANRGGGRRQAVKSKWSRQSRNRLLKTLVSIAKIERKHIYGITLTYRERTVEESKRDLNCLKKRLRRKLGSEWHAVWKMEFQRRGAVHYHIALFTNTPITREWVSETWAEITGDPQLSITGTRVDRLNIESVQQLLFYIGGHASKPLKEYQNENREGGWTGRWWGIWNKPKLQKQAVRVTWEKYNYIKRQIRKIRPIGKQLGFWTYTSDAVERLLKRNGCGRICAIKQAPRGVSGLRCPHPASPPPQLAPGEGGGEGGGGGGGGSPAAQHSASQQAAGQGGKPRPRRRQKGHARQRETAPAPPA